jgi:uncharacterized repeat protein (TIGR04042 family)
MPEILFQIAWPDGRVEDCYSPSLVVRDHFDEDVDYPLEDFMARARMSLTIASDRVAAKFGRPCSLALGQLAALERAALTYRDIPEARVRCLAFLSPNQGAT